jgi:3-deoxy-D-manno-octulosonate 8-phosphate phosphatase KdsC-like HAD superfamily phosphatase
VWDARVEPGPSGYDGRRLADIGLADAAPEVKAAAHLILESPGGYGAAREIAEKILKSQKKWRP